MFCAPDLVGLPMSHLEVSTRYISTASACLSWHCYLAKESGREESTFFFCDASETRTRGERASGLLFLISLADDHAGDSADRADGIEEKAPAF